MSEYNQVSFSGGMNLLLDDTRLQPNQYRVGFNLRNRYDVLEPVLVSKKDPAFPTTGVCQEVVTFGAYIIAFVGGLGYYRFYTDTGWRAIPGFKMSSDAERYWTVAVPVATTNYGRYANASAGVINSGGGVTKPPSIAGSFAGNTPGLLVQDGFSQPVFVYIDQYNNIQSRTTQTYDQWSCVYNASNQLSDDKREYVPIGKQMAYVNGVLYVASTDGNYIYRSVSGRPLDFVIAVDQNGQKISADENAGGASVASYSVGVGGITCLRGQQDGSLFVAASNANFTLELNMTQNAPTIYGEYTFIRKYLFEASCLTDRAIIDSLGDTKFVDYTGVRSFNNIEQYQNEGRNTPFTATIAAALKGITQDTTAAILFDNYEFYALNTVFGPVLAVYDTINSVWTSFDNNQVGGKKIKQLVKIELTITALFAVTEDDEFFQLYSGPSDDNAYVVTVGISANTLYANSNVKLNNAKNEIKPTDFRCIINRLTADTTASLLPIINNRASKLGTIAKTISYEAPPVPYTGSLQIPDINTQLNNLLWSLPSCEQGWKVSFCLQWSGGSVTQFSVTMLDQTPMNPLSSQQSTH